MTADLGSGKHGGGDTHAKAASRVAFVRAVAAVIALTAGVVGVYGLEHLMNAKFDKPPAPLQKSLEQMSKELGHGPSGSRYEATKPDEVLDPEVEATLGTPDYLLREYTDRTKPEDATGRLVKLNLNFYSTGSSTPHVPEICWAGAGRIEDTNSRQTFTVDDIPSRTGGTRSVHVRMISFKPDEHDRQLMAALGRPLTDDMFTNVAYVFMVNGQYVPTPQDVTAQFWKASYNYAYHAKLEVTPMVGIPASLLGAAAQGRDISRPMCTTRAEARQIVSDFLREAIPAAEECLPDPAILGETAPTTATH